ncbi:hypothetical protein ACHAXT_011247 [Thalassiosira profunda]
MEVIVGGRGEVNAAAGLVGRRRRRMRPFAASERGATPSAPAMTDAPKTRRWMIARVAASSAILLPVCTEAFSPSPYTSHKQHRAIHTPRTMPPSPLTPRHPLPIKPSDRAPPSSTSLGGGWLFTPDRTAGVLADTASEALVSTASAATDAAIEVAASAVETMIDTAAIASTVTTDTVVQTIYKAPFFSLAISFLLGGLFFSTVAATIAAIIALGKENTRRLREVAGIVWRRNWTVWRLSMQLTMDVLRGKEKMSGFKNRLPAALQAFKDGVAEVRRVFTESVDAIKKETQMYSAAVGLPGLIPIQYIFDRIFPSTLTAPFESALQDSLVQLANDNPQIRKLELKKFSMGDIAPRVLEARLFDLGNRDMGFDLEMNWNSNARAEIDMRVSSFGAKIPVTIQNLRFVGPVRLILVGLRPEEPGWEALLISLPRPPQIGFDIKVAGGLVTQIPWLRNELAKNLDNAVSDEVLWPRRAVVSAPSPYKTKPLLNPMQVLSLMRDDPLLRMERALMDSIPDEFASTYEASSPEDIPDFDIQEVNEKKENDEDDGDGDASGGTPAAVPIRQRLRFWQQNKQPATVEANAIDTVQLMAQSLKEQEARTAGQRASMPVMVLESVEEKKSFGRRILNNLLLPKSVLSYAAREGGI